MNLSLHPDWKRLLQHTWSVRFIALAFALSFVEVFLPLIQPYVSINPIMLAAGAALSAAAAGVARIIAQKEFEGLTHGS